MAEATDKIKDKIRKLLAKADNTACTVEEAKSFNDKAFQLMQEYNLDRAMLELGIETDRTHKELYVSIRPWSNAILHGLCSLYSCKWFYYKETKTRDRVLLVGEEQNVTVCHSIAVMILRAVQSEARTTGGGRSFMSGAGFEINKRCKDLVIEAKLAMDKHRAKAQVNALVLVDEQGNQEYIDQLTGGNMKQRRGRGASVRDIRSFAAGKEFGASLPLSQGQLGGKS